MQLFFDRIFIACTKDLIKHTINNDGARDVIKQGVIKYAIINFTKIFDHYESNQICKNF